MATFVSETNDYYYRLSKTAMGRVKERVVFALDTTQQNAAHFCGVMTHTGAAGPGLFVPCT